MKLILSRKGFDSSNGGCPSPIMPDGALLSMPIPSNDDKDKYSDLQYKGLKYSDLLKQINPKKEYSFCHIDPDIRDNNRVKEISGWKAAFGQYGSAQGKLANSAVEKGDIFLYFGWFRKVEQINGSYKFIDRKKGDFYDHADLHVIYGYMQIGEIYKLPEAASSFEWHPHAHYSGGPNVIYTPSDTLSLNPKLKGYGTLDFRKDRVLTLEGANRGTWIKYPFLMPENVCERRKNSASGEGLYYSGIWQELVIKESKGLFDWVRRVIE